MKFTFRYNPSFDKGIIIKGNKIMSIISRKKSCIFNRNTNETLLYAYYNPQYTKIWINTLDYENTF